MWLIHQTPKQMELRLVVDNYCINYKYSDSKQWRSRLRSTLLTIHRAIFRHNNSESNGLLQSSRPVWSGVKVNTVVSHRQIWTNSVVPCLKSLWWGSTVFSTNLAGFNSFGVKNSDYICRLLFFNKLSIEKKFICKVERLNVKQRKSWWAVSSGSKLFAKAFYSRLWQWKS